MRVVGLIDMDCFYAQVEQRDQPELWGKPVVVVQHAREGAPGGILAVSYEARSSGVKRGMMISEATQKCPELNLCFVPQGEHIDKADIQKYRDASAEVFAVLHKVDARIIVERASVDEAFLDLSKYVDETLESLGEVDPVVDRLTSEVSTIFPSSHLANGKDKNFDDDPEFNYEREDNLKEWLDIHCRNNRDQLRLAIATELVEKIRADILQATQFYCSAGIGPNKMLAKLVCARHKPRQQTVVTEELVPAVFKHTPIGDVRMLGGKMGQSLRDVLGVKTMGQLAAVSYDTIAEAFPSNARWIWQLARGLDDEPVKARSSVSSIAVSKNFPGKNSLVTVEEVKRWVDGLSKELSKRLMMDQMTNKRTAENLVVGVVQNGTTSSTTKTLKLNSYHSENLFNIIWPTVKTFNKAAAGLTVWEPAVLNIHFSASRFSEGIAGESKSIMDWVKERMEQRKQNRPETSAAAAEPIGEADVVLLDDEEPSVSRDAPSTSSILDQDGWQTYDPSKLVDAVVDAPGTTADMMEMGDVQVSRSVFNELPDFIKAELSHQKMLSEARRIKESAAAKQPSSSTSSSVSKPKKRPSKAVNGASKTEPPPKKSIAAFFKKQ